MTETPIVNAVWNGAELIAGVSTEPENFGQKLTPAEKFFKYLNIGVTVAGVGVIGKGLRGAPRAIPGLRQVTAKITKKVQKVAGAVDRWLVNSSARIARLYRRYRRSDPNFAALIRGRIIDNRMRRWFRREFGRIPGVRIDQTIPGSGSRLRPDLYFPSIGGGSAIFDVGSAAKAQLIEKYLGMARRLKPITY
jgi:hypothetical protein